MREVDSIMHPHCMTKIYNYNKKYIIKLSFGDINIEYKISEDEVPGGVPQIKRIFTQGYIDKHAPIFSNLTNDFQEAFEKANE